MQILFAALLLFTSFAFSPPTADSPHPPVPDSPNLEASSMPTWAGAWSDDLAAVVAAEAAYLPGPAPYTVTSFDAYAAGAEEWALAVIVPAAVVQAGWEDLDLDQLVDVLLVRDQWGAVRGHVRTHPAFGELAGRVPKQLVDYGPILRAAALGPSAQREEVSYRFPWTAGQTWWLGSGWHTGYGPDALDFSPLTDEDPPANSAVLAAAGGTLRMACQADQEQRLLWIDHPNGERTGYLHLDRASVAEAVENQGLIGQAVPQGTYLGTVYRGTAKTDDQCPANFPGCTFNTLCGYGNAAHLHFLAPNRSIRIDSYSIGDIGTGALGNRFTSSNERNGSMADTQAPTVWLTSPMSTTIQVAPDEDRLELKIAAADAAPAGPTTSATIASPSGVASVSVQFAFQDRGGAWHPSPWQEATPAGADTFTATIMTCTPQMRVPHNRPIRLSLRASDKAGNEAQVEAADLFRFDLPDVDGDCTVDLRDLVDVSAAIAGRIPAPDANVLDYDIDGDEQLTPADATALLARLQKASPIASQVSSRPVPLGAPLPGSRRVTFTPVPGPAGLRVAQSVAVSGTTAYVPDWRSGELAVVDMSAGATPTPTLSSRLALSERVFSLAMGRDMAYLADPQEPGGRVWVLATTQPLTPTAVGTITVAGEPWQVLATLSPRNDLAYVATGTAGLHVVDVTAPQTPTLLASLDTPGRARGLAVVDRPGGGRILLIADGESGLIAADADNPSRLQVLSTFDTPGVALDVTAAVSGSQVTAFVADGLGGLQVVDITDPANPQHLGSYPTASAANGAVLDGAILYVAAGWQGVLALDVANLRAPRRAGSYDTPGYAVSIQKAGDRLYVADGNAGLQLLQVTIEAGAAYSLFVPLAGKELAP